MADEGHAESGPGEVRYHQGCGGRLVDSSGETLSDFHGDVEFYQFNLRRSGTGGHETADGLPPGGWTFVARFTDGRLTRLTGGRESV